MAITGRAIYSLELKSNLRPSIGASHSGVTSNGHHNN